MVAKTRMRAEGTSGKYVGQGEQWCARDSLKKEGVDRRGTHKGQTEDGQKATSRMCCHRSQGREGFKKEDVTRVKCSKKGPVEEERVNRASYT